MLGIGAIMDAQGNGSHVVIVPKKDGTVHCCTDFRKVSVEI